MVLKQLISIVTGKIVLIEAIAIMMLLARLAYLEMAVVPLLNADKALLNQTIISKNERISAQNAAAKLAEVDPAKHEALPKEIVKIETKYVPVVQEIIKWKEDTNASDCDAAMQHLDRFIY